jgi:Phage derived protein Gp49-like (DUF891)
MGLREISRGQWGVVGLAVLAKNACPAADFIADLEDRDKAKLKALFNRFSEYGLINNREKFKKIADDLFEFKSFQIRIFCYITGRQLVITHGVKKKRDDLNPADIDRARRIRNEYEGIQSALIKAGSKK